MKHFINSIVQNNRFFELPDNDHRVLVRLYFVVILIRNVLLGMGSVFELLLIFPELY